MLNGGMSAFFPVIMANTKMFLILTRYTYTHVKLQSKARQNMQNNYPDLRLDINGRYVQ